MVERLWFGVWDLGFGGLGSGVLGFGGSGIGFRALAAPLAREDFDGSFLFQGSGFRV